MAQLEVSWLSLLRFWQLVKRIQFPVGQYDCDQVPSLLPGPFSMPESQQTHSALAGLLGTFKMRVFLPHFIQSL